MTTKLIKQGKTVTVEFINKATGNKIVMSLEQFVKFAKGKEIK